MATPAFRCWVSRRVLAQILGIGVGRRARRHRPAGAGLRGNAPGPAPADPDPDPDPAHARAHAGPRVPHRETGLAGARPTATCGKSVLGDGRVPGGVLLDARGPSPDWASPVRPPPPPPAPRPGFPRHRRRRCRPGSALARRPRSRAVPAVPVPPPAVPRPRPRRLSRRASALARPPRRPLPAASESSQLAFADQTLTQAPVGMGERFMAGVAPGSPAGQRSAA